MNSKPPKELIMLGKKSIAKTVFAAVLLSASFTFAGCASLPIQTARDYFKELYRRIPYKTEGNYRVINIFYATDRVVEEGKDASLVFRSKLAKELTYGALDVKIDPDVTLGKMLPDRLKRRGIIGVQKEHVMDEDAFMQQLSAAVASSPHNSLLVVVFGYKDNFEATAIKAAYFAYLLDVNTPILLFDWPGDQPVSISGYHKAQAYAVDSGPKLGELLEKVIHRVRPGKLWLKASSMGCQVVCDAFDYMYKCEGLSDPDAEITHVILAAPDVGEKEFEAHFKDKLSALSHKLTIYVSSNDNALLMSGFLNNERRLGRQRLKEMEGTAEAKEILYLKSLEPDKITLIDVTPINRSSFKHGYYLESPDFYDDFYLRVFDKEPNVNRRLYLLKYKNNVDYWVMQSGR